MRNRVDEDGANASPLRIEFELAANCRMVEEICSAKAIISAISKESVKFGEAIMKKPKGVTDKQDAEREAILDERETLRRQFPPKYSPDVGVFSDGKVEIMFKLTYSEAEKLARLLREHKE
jgi:hypothetical protein